MTAGGDAIINEGREAWAAVHRATDFEAWKKIAIALGIGRRHALRLANVNSPHGAKYSRAFGAWIDLHGFGGMPYGLRASLCKLADQLVEIEAWRAGLPEADRASQNNPQVILRAWRRAHAAPPVRHVSKPVTDGTGRARGKGVRPICFSAEHIKRAADALRECRSGDLYTMATAALRAAIRNRDDATDLLEDQTTPTPPARPRATKQAEVIAA
jgi:hypothetical protein